jgi:hypothetical protein
MHRPVGAGVGGLTGVGGLIGDGATMTALPPQAPQLFGQLDSIAGRFAPRHSPAIAHVLQIAAASAQGAGLGALVEGAFVCKGIGTGVRNVSGAAEALLLQHLSWVYDQVQQLLFCLFVPLMQQSSHLYSTSKHAASLTYGQFAALYVGVGAIVMAVGANVPSLHRKVAGAREPHAQL